MKTVSTIAGAGLLMLLLGGCVTVQLNPDAENRGDGRQAETIRCTGQQTLTLNEPETDYTLTGSCLDVAIEGKGLSVAADEIGELVIRGERNTVTVSEFETLTIEGQDNTVETNAGGDAVINGNGNLVHSDADLDVVNVRGQDNDVTADGSIGSFDENGSAR